MNRGIIRVSAVIAVLTAAVFYFIVDPLETSWAPKCMVHYLTGFDCPGCGSQRAVHALLHGDIPEAWRQNALLVILLPVVSIAGLSGLSRSKFRRFHDILHKPWAGWGIFSVIIVWTIVRNIPA